MSGYFPNNHATFIDLMIPKKAQNFELSTLRTLGILDTEFNNNNGVVGHQAKYNGKDLKTTAIEQFAKPGYSALDENIDKRCILDHQQSIRDCVALASSDLAGCYDRIIHTAAALEMLRIGVSHTRIKSMFSSIQKCFNVSAQHLEIQR